MKQLDFRLKVLKDAHLVVPNTQRKTFYSIRIEEFCGMFRVRKISGAMGKVWDKRTWEFATLDEAEKLFSQRIKEKTDPDRNSPRKYSIEYLSPGQSDTQCGNDQEADTSGQIRGRRAVTKRRMVAPGC